MSFAEEFALDWAAACWRCWIGGGSCWLAPLRGVSARMPRAKISFVHPGMGFAQGSTTAGCYPNPDYWREAVVPTWACNIAEDIEVGSVKASWNPECRTTGCMKTLGSSKEPRKTQTPAGKKSRRSERRK
jgi:hypothetical protein